MCPVYLHWERTLESLPLVSSELHHAPFPFADFVLFPFSVINFSQEYTYIVEPGGGPGGP